MDIKPPKNWQSSKPVQSSGSIQPSPLASPEVSVSAEAPSPKTTIGAAPLPDTEQTMPLQRRRRKLWWVLGGLLAFLLLTCGAGVWWYVDALQPRDATATVQGVAIEQGMTPRSIAALLEQKNIIRNSLAFEIYVSLNGSADSLQAGNYKLSASQSVADIVDHLKNGQNDTYNVIILPGLTLKQLADSNVKNSLAAQGFSTDEIQAAFNATYSSPVLKDRPSGASLEGYVYPETYQMRVGDSLESLIQRSIDELYSQLTEEGLIAKFAKHKLNIHEAITLASIVQKEVSNPADQPQVAQVFLKRLSIGMMLGSDVTYIYAANQAGVTPSVDIDSPYNTRKYEGLPPGPIANMNLSALEAVANPASGDYLYFVAGDDGKTYFSKTYEEHQANIAAHCKTLCNSN